MTATYVPHFSNGRSQNTVFGGGATLPAHGLEDDPGLYAKVVARSQAPAQTVTLDEAIEIADGAAQLG